MRDCEDFFSKIYFINLEVFLTCISRFWAFNIPLVLFKYLFIYYKKLTVFISSSSIVFFKLISLCK